MLEKVTVLFPILKERSAQRASPTKPAESSRCWLSPGDSWPAPDCS